MITTQNPMSSNKTYSNGTHPFIGFFISGQSGETTEGLLAVNPGTITNGAIDYPVWASKHPEFINGNNIVFPSNVAGMFLRNKGGNAGNEGNFQDDATAANGLSTSSNGYYAYNAYELIAGAGSGFWGRGFNANSNGDFSKYQTASDHTHSIYGDNETRPTNRAYQLYTIVDTFKG